ncbi:MAG: OmpA family protein [Bacteroidia bacterium]|nr:OmpA family protein [Bacteroidia bacterium]
MKLRLSLFLLALTLLPTLSVAQTADKPFMAGFSANFFDYQGPLTGNFGQYRLFDPGIAFAGYGYINNSFNYSLNTTFAPEVIYPTTENTTISTSLLDVKAMARWTILHPDKFFVPYIGTGVGLNTAANNLRVYVPAAVGFRLRFTETFGLQWESTWQQRISAGQYQPVSHMVGFVFALNTKPMKEPVKETAKDPVSQLPDRDRDGVPDRDDQCPDERGKQMYLGCPDPVQEPTAEITEVNQPAAKPKLQPQETKQPDPLNGVTPAGPIVNAPVITGRPMDQQSSASQIQDQASRVPSTLTDSKLNEINRKLQNIYFENASFELTEEGKSILDEVSRFMKEYPDIELQVLGHADATGSEKNNIVLAIQRAYKVKYYLVYDKEIRMARISSDGYSSNEPINTNDSEEGRSMNRRVELKVVRQQNSLPSTAGPRGDR